MSAPLRQITVEVSDTVYQLLRVLGPAGQPDAIAVATVLELLIDHAQQGVYRPGSWERQWVVQVFGEEWADRLEPGDPYGQADTHARRVFRRPRRRES